MDGSRSRVIGISILKPSSAVFYSSLLFLDSAQVLLAFSPLRVIALAKRNEGASKEISQRGTPEGHCIQINTNVK